MQKQKERMPYIDVVKAIAMISVVMFHACTNHPDTYLATNAYFIRVTSAYAMPVFFFVNGFLYRNKEVNRPIKMIAKKIKAYYVPFVCYNLFFVFAHNLFVALHMLDNKYGNGYYDGKEFLKHIIRAVTGRRELFAGALWFLGSILLINAIVIIAEFFVHKVGKEKDIFIVLGIIALVGLVAGNSGLVTERMKVDVSLANFIYFYFGMLYRHFDWNKFLVKKKYVYILLGLGIDLILSYNKLYNPFAITGTVLFLVLDYLNAFIGIVAVMMLAQIPWMEKSKTLRIIGRNTLDIMGLHFMLFKLVSWLMIFVYDLPITRLPEYPVLRGIGGAWWLVYTFVGISISTIFSVFRHKIFGSKKRTDVKRA